MADERAPREGYGFLFPKKDRQEGQPALTGKVTINGREVEIAAWSKVAKSGVKYLSIKVKTEQAEMPVTEQVSMATDDDIPF